VNNDGNYSITLTEDELTSIQVALAEQFMFFAKVSSDDDVSPKTYGKAVELREMFRDLLIKTANDGSIMDFITKIDDDPACEMVWSVLIEDDQEE
jgi:hypothetical protein